MIETTSAPLPVICLAGPTGSGKTAAALALAAALDGEVVNADSRQVYADFPLITAQPSPEERASCPHHLYGFLTTENMRKTKIVEKTATPTAKPAGSKLKIKSQGEIK